MSDLDDAPIGEAHKEALEARRRFFASRPDITPPVSRETLTGALPEALARAFGEEDCNQYLEAANNLYQLATRALTEGDLAAYHMWLSIAEHFNQRYLNCLWLHSIIID